MYQKFFKRFLDVVLSALALIVLSPVLLIVAVLVRTKLGSPVVFKQRRLGKGEKVFTMYKFRTMTDERDTEGNLLPDEVRLTKFGIMLRATSLDELPELLNILKGDMSIVGPRPLPEYYREYYTDAERHRHDERGGLTGYSQVMGRNYVKWEKKFEQDVYYINHCSFALDMQILIKTILVVLKRDSIETASVIVHDGVEFRPLDVERKNVHLG